MLKNRVDFHNELVEILGSDHVYFQPPESLKICYPAIVYSRYNIESVHADNDKYLQGTYYQVTVIDKNPDSVIVDRMSRFPTAKYSRHFASDMLNHDVFIVCYK